MTILFLRLMLLLPAIFPLIQADYLPLTTHHSPFHPLHVSTTDISYNAGDKQLEVICTIFTDDFESALSAQYHIKTDLAEPKLHSKMEEWVKKYIVAHVQISASGKPLVFHYVGFEKASESVNVYLESNPVLPPKKLDAQISILHNLYDDQMNIVHMTVGGKRKSTKLDYPDKMAEQVF